MIRLIAILAILFYGIAFWAIFLWFTIPFFV